MITLYVFVLSLKHTSLLAPTLLMSLDGLWKYFERTCALFFASEDSFRDSLVGTPEPGPNYARLMEEYFSAREAFIPTDFEGKDGRLVGDTKREGIDGRENEEQTVVNVGESKGVIDGGTICEGLNDDEKIIKSAYYFYELFKPLLADGYLSLKSRKASRDFFLRDKDAFRIIQIELNLIYDAFYTKLFLLHRRRALARLVCFFTVVASLVLFSIELVMDKSKYRKVDVKITFVLLGGAIFLDICGVVMFIMSDWWIIMTTLERKYVRYCKSTMLKILRCSKWARRPDRRRWSESISQYNLLLRCFEEPPSFFRCNFKRIRDILIGLYFVERKKVDPQLTSFVIEELQRKAKLAPELEVAKEVCSARGNLVLQEDYFLVSECLSPWTVDVDYDESLLIWHLATDICYWNTSNNGASERNRDISKALSDYMAYLLLRQQTLVSSVVGMSDTRFEDTRADAKKFMNYKGIEFGWFADIWWRARRYMCKKCCCRATSDTDNSPAQRAENIFFKQFSKEVLQVKADVEPSIAKGDKSKSVLFDACRLAKQLQKFGDKQWEITSMVWVELLCYAAIRCSARSHIAQLRKGGELITLVWLFMAHLGLGERFLQNQGFGWTKLVIQK